jgi:hypothetical protein
LGKAYLPNIGADRELQNVGQIKLAQPMPQQCGRISKRDAKKMGAAAPIFLRNST